MDDERLRTDLAGLIACALKVRWRPEVVQSARGLCDRLLAQTAVRETLAELAALTENPESVRYSFTEQRQEQPVSSGRELLLFLIGLVQKSLKPSG